jgi:hypothetical protein
MAERPPADKHGDREDDHEDELGMAARNWRRFANRYGSNRFGKRPKVGRCPCELSGLVIGQLVRRRSWVSHRSNSCTIEPVLSSPVDGVERSSCPPGRPLAVVDWRASDARTYSG